MKPKLCQTFNEFGMGLQSLFPVPLISGNSEDQNVTSPVEDYAKDGGS